MRSTYARCAATKSTIASPPNLSFARAGELPGDRRLGDDRERLDGGHVRALDERLRRLAGLEVDRAERLHQRRQRLHRGADDDLLAVRDAGLDAARVVRVAAAVGADLVVRLGAEQAGQREAVADLDTLHGLDPHQRDGEPCVEAVLLRRVRAEPRRHAGRAHLDHAADRVALRRAPRRFAPADVSSATVEPCTSMPIVRSSAFATVPAATWTAVCRAEARSSAFRTSSWPYFRTPARSACPGRGSVTAFVPLPVGSPSGGHGAIPHVQFLWSTFAHDERERRAERAAVAEAGEHLDAVLLDLLARRAAVALLPPLQVGVDPVAVELEPGGQAADDRHERGPVALSGRCERERHRLQAYGAAHHVDRRVDAGPEPEARRALAHERLEAVDDLAAERPRGRDERRLLGPVGEVDDRLLGVQLDEHLVADGRRVDDQVAAGRVGRPVGAPRVEARVGRQRGLERARRAAGADHARARRRRCRRGSPGRC